CSHSISGLAHILQVGGSIRVGRRPDCNEDHVGIGNIGSIIVAGEGQMVVRQCQHCVQVGFVDWGLPGLEQFDLFRVEIKAGDLMSQISEHDACVQTDIAVSDNQYFHDSSADMYSVHYFTIVWRKEGKLSPLSRVINQQLLTSLPSASINM